MATRTTGGPIKVFYSYSSKDERLRKTLETHLSLLKREGAISGWNFRKITAGREWEGDIDEHLNSARVILLLVSTDFLASNYCYDVELKRALERHEAGEARVIPIILRKCDWESAEFRKLQALPTNAEPVTSWRNRDEAWTDVAKGIRKAVEELTSNPNGGGGTAVAAAQVSAGKVPSLPPVWNVPERDPNFTGRAARLRDLHKALASQRPAALTQAIHGMGGIGKTQLATEYCYRHAAEYEIVWWVRSEEPAQLASDYAALAGQLGLQEANAKEQEVTIRAVRHWLGQNSGWLLTFDNVEKPDDIKNYMPTVKSGHLLITSRHQSWREIAASLPVEVWPRRESIDFLLKRTGQKDRKAAGQVAKELGDLPLAISQAGAYMEETGRSFADYLELLKSHQQELLKRGTGLSGYELTVATTWEASFVQIEKDSPAAGDLLNLCAFLAPDEIPVDIIRDGAEQLPERLAEAARDDLAWDDAIAALRRYSLVEVSGDALSVHRLVQAVTRERLADEDKGEWAGAAVVIVNAAFPTDVQTNVDAWPVCARLLPHALAVAAHAEELNVGQDAALRLLSESGSYLRIRAQLTDAGKVYERALRIAESYHDGDHADVATALSNLGSLLQALGDLAGARARIERALRIDEAAYGPEHPNVANRLNNLGTVLYDLRDLAGARAHFERALRIHEMAYGPDHHAVATDVNSLGNVLQDQGDLAGARDHYERALHIDEKTYGPDHPNVAIRVSNLGRALRALGDPSAALEHFKRAVEVDEAAYGPDHPEVAVDLTNLGSLLYQNGDAVTARAHYQRALEIFRRTLGDGHPYTVGARKSLEVLGR